MRDLAEGLPDERHIVHGNLVNHNVLVQGPQITAVIDWGSALYGDWLYDAAWLIFWWPWFPQWRHIDITAELETHWDQHDGCRPACTIACTPALCTSAWTPWRTTPIGVAGMISRGPPANYHS